MALPVPVGAGPKWERWALGMILVLAAAAGFNHVHTNTIFGQDFGLHEGATEEILKNASHWFPQDFTNRPMIYGSNTDPECEMAQSRNHFHQNCN